MLPAIKSFAREEVEARNYRSRVDRAMGLRIQEGRIYAALDPLIGLVAASAAVLLLYAAGRTIQSGSMTTAELFSFVFYAALLTRPVGALAHTYGQVQTARGTLARLQSVLETDVEPGYSSTGSVTAARGHISFANVGFGYPGRRHHPEGRDPRNSGGRDRRADRKQWRGQDDPRQSSPPVPRS